jgi:iron complex outermembrane receptor protein
MTRLALRVTVSASALAAAAAAFSVAGAAAAQTAPPPPASGQAAATAAQGAPPVVTVTAERRTVNLQTAPIPATVLAGNQLQDNGIYTLDDLQFHTPSLTVTDDGGAVLFNIRGLGKDLNNVQTPSGVVTYWDGVASFPGFFQAQQYYDIANVEVLRGPQGTFAGQNADAGAVFITTNDPHLGTPSGDLELQYGSYNDELARGFLNVPIGDTLALRAAFNLEQRDSFYHVAGPWTSPGGKTPDSYRDEAFRLSLLWQPTSNFKAVLKWDYDYLNTFGAAESPAAMPGPAPNFAPMVNTAPLFDTTNYTNTYAVENTQRVSLNAVYTFNDGVALKSITAYEYGRGGGDVDLTVLGDGLGPGGGPPYFDTFADWGRESIFSQELDLVSPDQGPLRWTGGLYYQHDYVTLEPGGGNNGFDIGVPPGVFDIVLNYHTPKETEAAFGQVIYDINPDWQLEVGARLTHESFGLKDTQANVFLNALLGLSPPTGHTAFPASYTATTSDTELTGKIALTWKLNETNTLYAFVAEGSKASGINTTPVGAQAAAEPFGPEHVTDFEAGWKPTLADGHLRMQFDGYYDLYQDFQLSFATPNEPGESFIRDVGGTTTLYGLEAEAQAVFGPLSFDAGASYEHSALGSASTLDPGPSPTAGMPLNLKGRVLPLAPEWTFNAGGQYAFPIGNGTLTPRIDFSYVSSQWGTPYQDIGDFLPGHDIVNAQITYALDRYKLTVYATNAFNTQYLIGSAIGLRYAGAPAQYGVRLEAKF